MPKLDLRIPPVAEALRLISQQIPEDMALTNLNVQRSEGREGLEVQLRGLVFGQKEEAFPVITSFMEQFENSPIFSNVELESAEEGGKQGAGALTFAIRCRLK
jgi:hypothetical protein